MMRKLTLLCLQTYHLVAKLKLQILFVVQSNGKRGICDVEKFGRTLDIDRLSLSFVFIFLSFVYLAIPVFASAFRLFDHENIATQAATLALTILADSRVIVQGLIIRSVWFRFPGSASPCCDCQNIA